MKLLFTSFFLIVTAFAFGQFGQQELIFRNTLSPTSIQSGDIDNDGDMDVVVAYDGNSRIVWYENVDGIGNFKDEQVISTEILLPQSLYLADIDNDQDLDVVIASSGDNTIAWFENEDGFGTYGNKNIISTNALNAEFVYVADLDNDGNLDVVSASSGDNKIAWYNNIDGLGSFSTELIISEEALGVKAIFIADLNNNGNLDVLAALHDENKIVWYDNIDGLGNFGVAAIIDIESIGAQGVTAADLDGDGDMDVAATNYKPSVDNKLVWYENMDGLGSFSPKIVIRDDYNGALDIIADDVNNDGNIDLLTSSSKHYAYLIKNLGNGQFQTKVIGDFYNFSICSADLNGDSNKDIIIGFKDGDNLKWYESNGDDINFFEKRLAISLAGANAVNAADFDADGDIDFVVTCDIWSNYLLWFENIGDGQAISHIVGTPSPFSPQYGNNLIPTDMDNDGDFDILSGGPDNINWHENTDGLGNFGDKILISTSFDDVQHVHQMDVDNDGDLDLIVRSRGSNDIIGWYEHLNGYGDYGSLNIVEEDAFLQLDFITTADLNADGFSDIISGGAFEEEIIWYQNQNGTGFSNGQVLLSGVRFGNTFSLADVDNDSDLDIIAFDFNVFDDSSPLKWFENTDGLGTFNNDFTIYSFPQEVRIKKILTNDLDNDGDEDIIAASDSNIYFFEKVNGSGAFSAPLLITENCDDIRFITLQDIDNDGDKDLLSASSGDNKIAFYRNLFNNKGYSEFCCNRGRRCACVGAGAILKYFIE